MSPRERGRGRRRRRRSRRRERRAIYLLPNLITTSALLLGFWSIILSFNQQYARAALAIVLARIADMLDGRVARATDSTSPFGIEYDSISDVISFGVAPAVLFYSWALAPLGPRAWVVAAVFTICAALRLARFNVHQQVEESKRYQGLPSTFAGGMVAVSVWFVGWLGFDAPLPALVGTSATVGFTSLALLMVSPLPYMSLKAIRIDRRNAYPVFVALVFAVVIVLLYHEPVLFAIGAVYVVSGPVLWVRGFRSRAVASELETAEGPEDRGQDARRL